MTHNERSDAMIEAGSSLEDITPSFWRPLRRDLSTQTASGKKEEANTRQYTREGQKENRRRSPIDRSDIKFAALKRTLTHLVNGTRRLRLGLHT